MKYLLHAVDFPSKTLRMLWLAGILLAAAADVRAAELPVLVLNDANEPPFTTADGQGFLDLVAGEAFRRAGVRLQLVRLPAERGLVNANSGLEDGDLTRIAGLEASYPNLVRVPEKLIDWEFSAFSRQGPRQASWDSLRTRSMGHIRGWKIYEHKLAATPAEITAEDANQLFRLLQQGRIEIALFERWQGLARIEREQLAGVQVLEPPLARREMYIYLHKRHAALVPKIARALRDIKAEGLYGRLYREKVLSVVRAPGR
ncbi:MAG: transporter substrate-binding domain-containing protein [Pseudomonadota bacterium]